MTKSPLILFTSTLLLAASPAPSASAQNLVNPYTVASVTNICTGGDLHPAEVRIDDVLSNPAVGDDGKIHCKPGETLVFEPDIVFRRRAKAHQVTTFAETTLAETNTVRIRPDLDIDTTVRLGSGPLIQGKGSRIEWKAPMDAGNHGVSVTFTIQSSSCVIGGTADRTRTKVFALVVENGFGVSAVTPGGQVIEDGSYVSKNQDMELALTAELGSILPLGYDVSQLQWRVEPKDAGSFVTSGSVPDRGKVVQWKQNPRFTSLKEGDVGITVTAPGYGSSRFSFTVIEVASASGTLEVNASGGPYPSTYLPEVRDNVEFAAFISRLNNATRTLRRYTEVSGGPGSEVNRALILKQPQPPKPLEVIETLTFSQVPGAQPCKLQFHCDTGPAAGDFWVTFNETSNSFMHVDHVTVLEKDDCETPVLTGPTYAAAYGQITISIKPPPGKTFPATGNILVDLVSGPPGTVLRPSERLLAPAASSARISLARAGEYEFRISCGSKFATHKVRALDLAIVPDFTRDGVIDSMDTDVLRKGETPFAFWINDDNDGTTYNFALAYSEQDDEKDDEPNVNDNEVNGTRDLEDFDRLKLLVGGLEEEIRLGTMSVGLKWIVTGGVPPAIKVWRNLATAGGPEYLFSKAMAEQHTSLVNPGPVVAGTTYVIPADFWRDGGLSESQSYGNLLFEGWKAGQGKLCMVLLDAENNELAVGQGLSMDLKFSRDFIQRWSCGDADRGPIVPYYWDFTKSVDFGTPTQEEEKDLVLYVHGYNMAEYEKQRWIETTYKRLHWLGYRGRVGGFTWPCSQSTFYYDQSEFQAWRSARELNRLLKELKAQGYRVHLLAHSQGNIVASEALRLSGPNSRLVETYVATQAAVLGHNYNPKAELFPIVDKTPNVYMRYWRDGFDEHRPSLWPLFAVLPSYFAPEYIGNAAKKFANFYNPLDFALTMHGLNQTADGGFEVSNRNKPQSYSRDEIIGFYPELYQGADSVKYRYSDANGFDVELDLPGGPSVRTLKFDEDRYEIFSFCAQGRSKALGVRPTGGVFENNGYDLSLDRTFDGENFKFGDEHRWHSAQFRSDFASRWPYWQAFLGYCDLNATVDP